MVTASDGLTSAEAALRLRQYGPNAIPEKRRSLVSRLMGWIATPISLMFIAAGGLSLWAGRSADAGLIAALFAINIAVGIWHEAKADTAIRKLKEHLTVTATVRRDGAWKPVPSAELVPGDLIELTVGSLVPADIAYVDAKHVTANESAVTGESLPKEKQIGDAGYAGTFLSTGAAQATVTATGPRTYFGKTLSLVETTRRRSGLEQDILSVTKFLSLVSVGAMLALTVVLALAHSPLQTIAELDISMLIAGVPVAMATVMTLIISAGVTKLAEKSVIVRRLSSLEDLANVNLLLSDKTGTLTENRIAVTKLVPLGAGVDDARLWKLALAASPAAAQSPIADAVRTRAAELGFSGAASEDFIPGDSDRKRTTAFIQEGEQRIAVSLGAPQEIESLCAFDRDRKEQFDREVGGAAAQGLRVLALAVGANGTESGMQPLALFFLADAVRPDAKETIDFMRAHGIDVKLVTGDNADVAAYVAKNLGLPGMIIRKADLPDGNFSSVRDFAPAAGFAEVLPKDKYDLVTAAQGLPRPYIAAVTGDGVNDVPPVKAAAVGIAVSNAVDALKGAADIVLAREGIAVIKDAILEARKIFMRLYNYSVYRISESFRLIITISVIGILFHAFLLTPIQIILIAILNDVPIVTLAFDRVAIPSAPATIAQKKRLGSSIAFGMVGLVNSMTLLWIALALLRAPWSVIQTLFFLKLTVSGHMLIYVSHTERPWYRFLPAKPVIIATIATQLVATLMAKAGWFVVPISWGAIAFVWGWSFLWMQVAEGTKQLRLRKYGRQFA